MGIPTEPIGSAEHTPIGIPVFSQPIYELSPFEPANGALLIDPTSFLLIDGTSFLAL